MTRWKLIATGVGVFLMWLITPILVWQIVKTVSGEEDLSRQGQFGDIFGSVNSLFSGAALLMVSLATYLQYKALEEQKKQMTAQDAEQKKLQAIQDEQLSILKLQRVEMERNNEEARTRNEVLSKQLEIEQRKLQAAEYQEWANAQPEFVFKTAFCDGAQRFMSIIVLNEGAPVFDVDFECLSGAVMKDKEQVRALKSVEGSKTSFALHYTDSNVDIARVKVRFRTPRFGIAEEFVICRLGDSPRLELPQERAE